MAQPRSGPKYLTAGYLKELLAAVPDDTPVAARVEPAAYFANIVAVELGPAPNDDPQNCVLLHVD